MLALAVVITLTGMLAHAAPAGRTVEFGKPVRLTGTVPRAVAGERVDILALPYGSDEYVHAAAVSTGKGGTWQWTARPRIRTTYRAVWNSVPTSSVVVRVSPDLDLLVGRGGQFTARARCEGSLAGHRVTLQLRRPGGRWHALRRLVLNDASRAVTRLNLRRGRHYLRLSMTAAEAGPGYDRAYSAVVTFTRK